MYQFSIYKVNGAIFFNVFSLDCQQKMLNSEKGPHVKCYFCEAMD